MEEIWKDVVGYEGHYQVSDKGNIKTVGRYLKMADGRGKTIKSRNLKLNNHSAGYLVVSLSIGCLKKSGAVHRLVAESFLPNPENKKTVNHKNGIKNDNRVENLEWATFSENNFHAYRIGLKFQEGMKGDKHHQSKLTDDQAREIKYSLFGMSQSDIAKTFNVSQSVVSSIRRMKTWKHI